MPNFPVWLQWIIGVPVISAALYYIWSKLLRPGARLVTTMERMVPLLNDLTKTFEGKEGVFAVLNEIVEQVRTDSGSSLLDVVNRLETAAMENARVAQEVKVGMEANRLLSKDDRESLRELSKQLDRLSVKVDELMADRKLLDFFDSAKASAVKAANEADAARGEVSDKSTP